MKKGENKVRGKKSFLISLDSDLVKELEKRAKKDKLTVQELINLILYRSAMRSLRKRNPRTAEKLIEIFSRYRPPHKDDKQTYYCKLCGKNHRYESEIGEKHLNLS